MAIFGRGARTATCVLVALWCSVGAVSAQAGTLLPERRHFASPLADPMSPRISASLLRTDLLSTQGPERPPYTLPDAAASAREVVAAVSVGAVFPLVQLASWEGGGAQLVADGRVFARFRIRIATRDDMGQDWWVGGAVEAEHGATSGRVGILHRSSHLGDEFMIATGAERIEFGGEQLDAAVAHDVRGVARVYGAASWIFRSYLGWEPLLVPLDISDRGVLQFGADRQWRPWADPRLAVHAGVDVHMAERTNWVPGYAAAAGIGVHTSRALRLTARGYDGLSMMGEFFLTRERYVSLELSAEF